MVPFYTISKSQREEIKITPSTFTFQNRARPFHFPQLCSFGPITLEVEAMRLISDLNRS